jgi:ATP-binding cassette subfamily A (ABC1) protein 3
MASFGEYTTNGYSIIHNWLANFVLRKNFPTDVDGWKPTITHMAIPMGATEYVNDMFAQVLGILAFFLFNSYLVPLYRLTYRIVNEKETRARESMKMMGLTDTSYWLSWFTYYFCVVTIISIVGTLMVKDLIKTDKLIFFITIWLFGISLFGYALIF